MGKPFFYKIVAAEFMAEVLQIPDGQHKEWLIQFVLDLVAAKGTTPYASKLVYEVQKFREKQAISGSIGGKKSRGKKTSDPQAPLKQALSDPQANSGQALGISSSSSISNELPPIQGTNKVFSDRTMEDENGKWDIDTGEAVNDDDYPFGRGEAH